MTGGQDDRGPAERARADPLARARGRQADHRHDRGPEPLPRRRARRRSPRCATATSCSTRSASWPQVEGVTVLIHDQECAAELRRARKRGKARRARRSGSGSTSASARAAATAAQKSSCLSVQPVETEFGRKTQIHQASCNKDFSCLEGDCPSFLTVVPGRAGRSTQAPAPPSTLPEPAPLVADARLRRADGGHRRHRRRDRQPGARHGGAARRPARARPRPDRPLQKGGPVVSDLRITRDPLAGREQGAGRQRRPATSASTCSAPRARRTSRPPTRERTVAVVSTAPCRPAAWSSTRASASRSSRRSSTRSTRATRASDNLYLDARSSPSACSATTC